MKLPLRRIIATTMMVIYLCISLSPLLSTALASKAVLHAVTGECSGDCDVCGCSAPSRAAGTCCCAKKKQQSARVPARDSLPDCCKKGPQTKEPAVILSCGCPCGDSKSVLVSGAKSVEVLPYFFEASLAVSYCNILHFEHPQNLISRYAEPPDPPPRQA